MKKLKIVILREYFNKVKKKSFLILTFLAPVIMVALFSIVGVLIVANQADQSVLYVLDETNYLTEKDLKDNKQVDFQLIKSLKDQPKDFVASKKDAYGLLVIPSLKRENIQDLGKSVKLYSNATPNTSIISYIERTIEKRFRKVKMDYYEIEQEVLDKIDVNVDISYISYSADQKEEVERDETYTYIRFIIGMIVAMGIYMFIFVHGASIMRSVLEEKTTRVIEVIISSVKPFQLMIGKIVAAGLVAITQFGIWGILAGISSLIFSAFIPQPDQVASNEAEEIMEEVMNSGVMENIIMNFEGLEIGKIIFGAFFLFILGYLLYSSIFAAIGAASDTETDTQQFMLPVTIPLVLAIYVGISLQDNPDGPVGMFMSMFPLTSPIVMAIRLPFGVPWWELLTAIILLLLSFMLMVKISSKIYQHGLLNFGKKASYKDLWKWIRMKD